MKREIKDMEFEKCVTYENICLDQFSAIIHYCIFILWFGLSSMFIFIYNGFLQGYLPFATFISGLFFGIILYIACLILNSRKVTWRAKS